MSNRITITAQVNGEKVTRDVEPRQSLVDFLREELELTGSHVGCEHGVCGACTVRLNGEIVRLAGGIGRGAPVNAAIVELVRQAEAGGRRDWTGPELLARVGLR